MHRTKLIKKECMLSQYLAPDKTVTLSPLNWSLFVNALEKTPTKNVKLTEALVLHKKSVVR